MPKSFAILSVSQFLQLADKYSELKKLPTFAGFFLRKDHIESDLKKKGGCSGCKKRKALEAIKPVLDNCFVTMPESDRTALKKILDAEKVCYYQTDIRTKKTNPIII